MSTIATAGASRPRRRPAAWATGRRHSLDSAFVWVAVVLLVIALAKGVAGVGDIARGAHLFPFEILALFIALEGFSSMVVATGVADKLAVRLATWSRGRRGRTLLASVMLLVATCAMGNNLTHVGLILPVLLVVIKAMQLDRRYTVAYLSLVMAVVNLAGAATPVGDFPALVILNSGITTFSGYLTFAFPLFAIVTAGSLLAVYAMRLARRDAGEPAPDSAMAQASTRLLEARYRHARVDVRALRVLLGVLAAMFAGWVFVPSVPPWAIAWAGLGIAGTAVRSQNASARMSSFDLVPAVKIGAFLALASFIATTGAIEALAKAMQASIHDPVLMLGALMLAVAVVTALVSAGPTAAIMLPVAQLLVLPGALLHGHSTLVAVAFAAAICAGSSALLTSATAGLYIQAKVAAADLRDEDDRPITFTFAEYAPYGLLNATIQLIVGMGVCLTALALS